MRYKVSYEWDIEELDEHGDIINHNHADKLKDLPDVKGSLVLVRSLGNEYEGLVDRQWAYVYDMYGDQYLPRFFSDSGGDTTFEIEVPKRFHKEFQRFIKDKN
jgi:hypothetical protein